MHFPRFILVAALMSVVRAQVQTYPIPEQVKQSFSHAVKVRGDDGEWKPVSAYLANLHEINITTGSAKVHPSSLATFDFDGSVEVSVTYNNGNITTPRIRPDSHGFSPSVEGNTLTFTLFEPKDLVIQTTSSVFDVLHLITNRIPTDIPSENDPDVVYFGPGYHTLPSTLNITSNKTLYLAPGAVLNAAVSLDNAAVSLDNAASASIRGHGILYRSPGGAISAQRSSSITIESITVLNPGHFSLNAAETQDLTVRNFRSISAAQWGDGIDLYSCENVLIEGAFLRNSDDCLAVYNHRNDWYGDTTNITLRDSALWADVAHAINIGTHGNTANPETMSGLTIENVDIMDHRDNLVRDVLISDVRVEDFRMGQVITMMVMYNQKYNTSPGRGISNVTVRNLSYKGGNANTAIMTGYDRESGIEFVRFENLTINGVHVSDSMRKPGWYATSDFVPMYVNEHVRNLTFT